MNRETIIKNKVLKEKVLLMPNPKYSKEINRFIEEANNIIKWKTIPIAIFLTIYEVRKEVEEIINKLQKRVSKQKNEQAIGWHNGLEGFKLQFNSQQKSSGACNVLANGVSGLSSHSADTKTIDKILEGDWIKNRIKNEFRKHNYSKIDWSLIAQSKIKTQIKNKLKELNSLKR